jgi:hypothetical protein
MWRRAIRAMATPPRSKTTLAGVAIASKAGIFPDRHRLQLNMQMDTTYGHTTAERLAADVAGAEEGVDHYPPRQQPWTGWWDLAHHCMANHHHRHFTTALGQPPAEVPSCQGRRLHRACLPLQPRTLGLHIPRWIKQA